jgi:hypothetical protein
MKRLLVCVPLAAAAMLWVSSTVLAGGWAVTTLDPVPREWQAGQTYRIGYMIRQHGVSPMTFGTPAIRIHQGGERLTFKGVAEGAPGHYVSEVTFPGEGDWSWEVDQAPFPQVQALGSIAVQAGIVPALKAQPPVELIAVLVLLALMAACAAVVLVYSTPRFRDIGGWLRACLGQTVRRVRLA